MKKFFAAMLVLAGIATFAGTCVVSRVSLVSTDGAHDTFAGQLDNTSGVNFLQHDFVVAFLDANNNVVETQTVPGCLRSVQNGTSDFFSAVSTLPASSTVTGLARVAYDGTFKVGTTTPASVSFTNISAVRNGTGLVVAGTVTNNTGSTLLSPNACIVVRTSAGNVLITGGAGLADIGSGASQTFTRTITVPNDGTAYTVDVWVDALDSSGNPTTPQANTGMIVANGANKLVWSTEPEDNIGGTIFAYQPVVLLEDASGNIFTGATSSVTLSVVGGPGTLTCTTNSVNASGGVATFSGCNLDKAGTYILRATSSGFTSADTTGIVIGVGAATKLGFTTQPGPAAISATALARQPLIQVEDAGGNAVAQPGIAVTLGSSPSGSGLACAANPVTTDANGAAAFTGCSLSIAGSYALTASGTYAPGTSTNVAVSAGVATKLAFTTQPSATAAATAGFAQQPTVAVEDAAGNVVTSDNTTSISLAIAGPGPGALSCTANAVVVSAGVATFAGCNVSAAGTNHLVATATPGLTTPSSTDVVTT